MPAPRPGIEVQRVHRRRPAEGSCPRTGASRWEGARQDCGQLGKRAHCQAAVYAAYLGRGAAALVDRRLYLNRDWVSGANHVARRQRTGVPADTPFRTKPDLALDGVDGLELGYLAEVPRNTQVWTQHPTRCGAPSQAVAPVADQLPRAAWRPFVLREGSKGPQAVLCAVLRWPIEQCFRDGQQLFGLGDYESRRGQGWHRHTTLVMLAQFFVVRETLRLKKSTSA